MKYKVTLQNIKQVNGLLNKALKGKEFTTKQYYPANKKQQEIKEQLKLKGCIITNSAKTKFIDNIVELSTMFGKTFIRVHNNLDLFGVEEYEHSRYRAFLIKVGDVIEFKGRLITIRCEHPTSREKKSLKEIRLY